MEMQDTERDKYTSRQLWVIEFWIILMYQM